MLPLALNTVTMNSMRTKHSLVVGALPVVCMFGSFLPLYWFAAWLEGALGIPHNSPIRAHPNGTRWVIVFLVVMVAGMITGYFLGWILDAMIARYLLKWPTSRVVAIFWRSEVPAHWIKSGEGSADVARAAVAKWEEQRKVGALRFVLARGVASWGVFMFVAMYLVPTIRKGAPVTLEAVLVQIALWAYAGAVFGAILWYFSEANYRRLKR